VLATWCELRQAFRNFRTDRILAAAILPQRLPRRRRQLAAEWRRTLLPKTDSKKGYTVPTTNTVKDIPMQKELIFYTHPQSRGGIVHWMLEETGCPYTIKTLDYASTMKGADYLAINPMGKVPAIRHGDDVVTEAAAICAYLADAFPDAGLSPAPEARAAYYRWLFFTAACCEPAMSNRSAGWDPATPDMQRRFGYGSFDQTFQALANWLKGRRFVAGDRFSAADVYIASLLDYGMGFDVIPRMPEFEAYTAPLRSRPARQRAVEQTQKLTEQRAWETV
jgi:glutathione S-transferase